jgi:phosphoribosylanthranilate isomerase
MTWIKICGITNLEDARTAVEAGADAVGFVFYEKSPRNIHPDAAREIVTKLPSEVEKVGVFVETGEENALWERIEGLIQRAELTAIQLQLGHSNVSGCCLVAPDQTKLYLSLPATWLAENQEQLKPAMSVIRTICRERPGSVVMLDSSTPEQPGGTGKVFDWKKSVPVAQMIGTGLKVIVAGGLTPANVKDAISILHPWGVDVSSGVEATPGKKDPAKIRAFVAAVREAEVSW